MTASTVKSDNVTNLETTPLSPLRDKTGRLITVIDHISVATTSVDEAGDVILLGPIPSDAVLVDLRIVNDDLDSNVSPALAMNIGLYYSGVGGNQKYQGKTSGTVVDADCIGSAVTQFQSAVVSWTSQRFEAADITSVTQEAWELGGLSADPGGFFYIGLTVSTAAGTAAAGDVCVWISYLN